MSLIAQEAVPYVEDISKPISLHLEATAMLSTHFSYKCSEESDRENNNNHATAVHAPTTPSYRMKNQDSPIQALHERDLATCHA